MYVVDNVLQRLILLEESLVVYSDNVGSTEDGFQLIAKVLPQITTNLTLIDRPTFQQSEKAVIVLGHDLKMRVVGGLKIT